ncbi:unnamed protein product [Plutella xylostella]|uniref:(diamondback moth) hypothetical protein n=1 Tax=Plutella xylostella TaxID=51655 RepID=A0A8S4DXF1_PLUXY|nr:unnamed protein product [Plutella xylostella]
MKPPMWNARVLIEYQQHSSPLVDKFFGVTKRTATLLLLYSGRRVHDLTLLRCDNDHLIDDATSEIQQALPGAAIIIREYNGGKVTNLTARKRRRPRPRLDQSNNWASIVAACTRGRLPDSRWTSVTSPGALAALSALLVAGGSGGAHAAHTLLAAARACPALRAPLLHALLNMPPTFQSGSTRSSGGVRAVCALVQQLCVTCAVGSVEAYTRWLAAAAERYLRHRTAVSAAPLYTVAAQLCVTCATGSVEAYTRWLAAAPLYTVAAVLWTLKEENLLENLEELITDDLFELIYTWVKDVPEDSMLKKSLDSILCSMCYIRPVLFRMLLEQMDVPMEETANSMESQTDDRKVSSPQRVPPPPRSNMAVRLAGRRLATAGAAALSPSVAPDLLLSGLPHAVAHAVTDFSIAKLQEIKAQVGSQEDIQMTDSEKQSTSAIKPETACMKTVCQLVEWLRQLCMERRLKDWLGAAGAVFWRPLLHLLCYPRPSPSTWQEGAQYAELEESTIRLFAELTTCHADNQKLFASTLHNIVETLHCTGPEGISGFTRALILRLLLSSERVRVGLRWGAAGAGGASPGRHPAEHSLTVVDLPTHTTVRTLLREHRPPVPQLDDTAKFPSMPSSSAGASYLVRRASDTAISTAAEVWELSIAAASASKDKRIKDVKNTTLKQQQVLKRQNKASSDAAVQSATDEIFETNIRVTVAGISGSVPAHATLAQLSAAAPHVFGPHLTVNFTPHQPGIVTGHDVD